MPSSSSLVEGWRFWRVRLATVVRVSNPFLSVSGRMVNFVEHVGTANGATTQPAVLYQTLMVAAIRETAVDHHLSPPFPARTVSKSRLAPTPGWPPPGSTPGN